MINNRFFIFNCKQIDDISEISTEEKNNLIYNSVGYISETTDPSNIKYTLCCTSELNENCILTGI